ncbi:MAG: flagellar export protein FliJ [Lachnospiraceae bacterium]|nr:flagellar export protein FliJ [Lachnospiraceae bacterium]
MAKFVYGMQNILELKVKMEDQRKAEYGLANAKLREEEEKLKQLLIRKAGYEKRARDLVKGKIDVQKIKTCRHAVDAMKSAIRTQMMEIQVAEKNVELARGRLNHVMMERKTHEKLREKAFEEFKQDVAYEENREIDQLVSYSYHRGS